jgi:hypothetical protein
MPQSTFTIGGKPITIGYDQYGICNNKATFRAVSSAVSDVNAVDTGLTGGSHGTDHPFEDYEAGNGWTVRIVRPGAMERGWIEVRPPA